MKKTITIVIVLLVCITQQVISQENTLLQELELKVLNGQNDSAILIADEILKADSLNWMASFYKGKALYSRYKYFDALHLLKRANELDTSNAIIENALAETYDIIGNDEAAIQIYYDQYLRDTNKIEPIVKLANMFRKGREYGSAIHYYQKATTLDFENFYYYKQQAYCLNKIELPQPAIYAYEGALMFNPYDLKVYQQLSNLYNSERMFDDAIATSDRGLIHYPDDNQLIKIKAYAYYLRRDFDSSIVNFNKLLEKGDSSYFNLKYQGLAFFEIKEFEKAIRNLKLAFQIDSKDAETCFFLGSAQGRSNDNKEGLLFLNKSLKLLEPSPVEVSNIFSEMAYVYQNQKEYELALKHLKSAYKYNATPVLSFKMAQLYDYFIKNRRMAISYYDGYLVMVNPTISDDSAIELDNHKLLQDSDMIQNAKERIRVLKEELFFESVEKE